MNNVCFSLFLQVLEEKVQTGKNFSYFNSWQWAAAVLKGFFLDSFVAVFLFKMSSLNANGELDLRRKDWLLVSMQWEAVWSWSVFTAAPLSSSLSPAGAHGFHGFHHEERREAGGVPQGRRLGLSINLEFKANRRKVAAQKRFTSFVLAAEKLKKHK